MRAAYTLAVAGHKGGTGRTTAALALSWCWGQSGHAVTLIDADPTGSCGLVARGDSGRCEWPNVRLLDGFPADARQLPDRGLAVIDCPSLSDPAAPPILEQADALVLCVLPDPLALRTVPNCAATIERARVANPRLELLGILAAIYDNLDATQTEMLERLRARHGELLLEPPVPLRPELRDWPLRPGAALPAGPAREAYLTVARQLEHWVRPGVGA
jgi:cellulose biosynthesis protein BcsQ